MCKAPGVRALALAPTEETRDGLGGARGWQALGSEAGRRFRAARQPAPVTSPPPPLPPRLLSRPSPAPPLGEGGHSPSVTSLSRSSPEEFPASRGPSQATAPVTGTHAATLQAHAGPARRALPSPHRHSQSPGSRCPRPGPSLPSLSSAPRGGGSGPAPAAADGSCWAGGGGFQSGRTASGLPRSDPR